MGGPAIGESREQGCCCHGEGERAHDRSSFSRPGWAGAGGRTRSTLHRWRSVLVGPDADSGSVAVMTPGGWCAGNFRAVGPLSRTVSTRFRALGPAVVDGVTAVGLLVAAEASAVTG